MAEPTIRFDDGAVRRLIGDAQTLPHFWHTKLDAGEYGFCVVGVRVRHGMRVGEA